MKHFRHKPALIRRHSHKKALLIYLLCCLIGICLTFFWFIRQGIWSVNLLDNNIYLKVHYLDVGQGDCTLLESDGHFMLIDAGGNESKEYILRYLAEQSVSEFDYIIATHPHEDHIGSMDEVLSVCSADLILMPDLVYTSTAYDTLMNTIAFKNIPCKEPSLGEIYPLGNASFQIMGPVSYLYEDVNDYSVCVKVTCGNTSFLFTGDAEKAGESDMIKTGENLHADVYHAGHHGSDTSSTSEFLALVSPSYIIISSGADNAYGHPHQAALDRFYDAGASVFRTDQSGTILAVSDGQQIHISH